MDPHCFDADPKRDPDPAQNLDADPDQNPDPGGGGMSAINVNPPWQNPRYAPVNRSLHKYFISYYLLIGRYLLYNIYFSMATKMSKYDLDPARIRNELGLRSQIRN